MTEVGHYYLTLVADWSFRGFGYREREHRTVLIVAVRAGGSAPDLQNWGGKCLCRRSGDKNSSSRSSMSCSL